MARQDHHWPADCVWSTHPRINRWFDAIVRLNLRQESKSRGWSTLNFIVVAKDNESFEFCSILFFAGRQNLSFHLPTVLAMLSRLAFDLRFSSFKPRRQFRMRSSSFWSWSYLIVVLSVLMSLWIWFWSIWNRSSSSVGVNFWNPVPWSRILPLHHYWSAEYCSFPSMHWFWWRIAFAYDRVHRHLDRRWKWIRVMSVDIPSTGSRSSGKAVMWMWRVCNI